MKADDTDRQNGRVPLFVLRATKEAYEAGRDALLECFIESALCGKCAFAGIRRMEEEVIQMALDLFHARADAQGFFTTGGAESIV